MTVEMEDDWNWMINSLKKYRHLHMYELSQPTQVLEWAKGNDVFVADSSSVNHRYEVLLLSLPPKLVCSNNANSKLTKDRDFKMVSGGFHSQPVHSMAMVSEQHFVTSSPTDNGDLLLWEIQDDNDFIVAKDAFNGERSEKNVTQIGNHSPSIAGNPQQRFQVARGSVLKNLEVVDLENGKTLWSNNMQGVAMHPIGSIDWTDNWSLLVCAATSGQLHMFDTRYPSHEEPVTYQRQSGKDSVDAASKEESLKLVTQKGSEADIGTVSGSSWTCSLNTSSRHNRTRTVTENEGRRLAAVLSPEGEVFVYDLRDLTKPVCSARVTKEKTAFSLCIRWSPKQKDLLSVSGWDNCVRIYDIRTFTSSEPSQSTLAEPVFIHDGHTNLQEEALWVTKHLWHEDEPNLLLSAGSDGSLHAWDWLPS